METTSADVPPARSDSEDIGPEVSVDAENADVDLPDVDDVCLAGATTCESLVARRICADDGGSLTIEPCEEGRICYLGQCLETLCGPEDPGFCDDGVLMKCNSLGLEFAPVPCAPGKGCADGQCRPIRANVVLVVDTSGSMSLLYEQPDVYPDECEGAGCPAWSWPDDCEDAEAAVTRIGRARLALQTLITSDVAQKVRLSLAHFPQNEAKFGDCKAGWYAWLLGMSGDQGAHQAGPGWFVPNLTQILAVPFRAETEDNDVAELLSWVDFEESVDSSDEACTGNFECASNVCTGGFCRVHTDPELRGDGPTPLGRTLFYVGEYLRTQVLLEGKLCQGDEDCPSPHYACSSGRCHDPFFGCRETAVVLFTDGGDSVDDDPQTFFHPRVQAKRMRYGLECEADSDCLAKAQCIEEQCSTAALESLPERVCKTGEPCDVDEDCPPFACGTQLPCQGKCEPAHVDYVEGFGNEVLVGYDGHVPSVITHVVDASGGPTSNHLIAMNGGGAFATVDFDDVEALAAQLVTLIDMKSPACGGP